MRRLFITTAAAALFFAGGVANAHPKLVSSSPAANAAVATPEKISLQFSEKLVPAFSKADLTMAAMPGMAAMKMPAAPQSAPMAGRSPSPRSSASRVGATASAGRSSLAIHTKSPAATTSR